MAVIGWNSIGANSDATTAGFDSQAYLNSSGLTYTASTGDTVTEFACYGDGTGTVEMAIYTVVGGVPSARVGSSSNVSIGSGANWYTTSTSIALTNGVEYTVALRYFVDESWNIRWSSIGTNQQSNGTSSPTPLPSTWSNNGTDTGRVSYYATVSGSGTTLVVANSAHTQATGAVALATDTAAVATTSSENSTSLGSSNAIAAPSGVATGNLLLAFCSNDAPTVAITASTGWVEIIQSLITGNVHRMAVFGRVADGSGSDALALSGTAQDYCASILRITDHSVLQASIATDVKSAATNSASNGAIDPPNLSAGSSRPWLWLAAGCTDMTNAADTLTTVPTGYTSVISSKSASSTTSSGMAVASKGATASSENPATFTNTARAWIGITLAVPGVPFPVDLVVADAAHAHAAGNVPLVVDLVVDAAAHAQAAENVALVVDLVPANAAHTQAAETPTLTFDVVNLTVADGAHAQAAEHVVLGIPPVDLAVDPAAHAQAAENLDLIQNSNLAVDDAAHTQTAENVLLVQQHELAVDAASHAHSADSIILVVDLAVDGAAHAQAAGNVELVQAYSLVVDDALHAQAAENVGLSTDDTLGIADAHHVQAAETVELVQQHQLVVADAAHGHTAESPDLVQQHELVVADAAHAQVSGDPVVGYTPLLEVESGLHGHTAGDVTLNVGGIDLLVADAFHGHVAGAPVLVHNPLLVVADCFHGHTATSIGAFPPDSAPGEVDVAVLVDGVQTTVVLDEVDIVVFVDAVDVTVIGGNP